MSIEKMIRALRRRSYHLLGMIAMRAGKKAFAESRFRSVLELFPDDVVALSHRAWLLADMRRFEEAAELYRRVTHLAAQSGAGFLGLANTLQQLGRHDEAIEAFREAIQRDPGDPLVHYNLAQSLVASGRVQEAAVLYRRVAALDPSDAEALGNLGATLGRLGYWKEALEFHERAMTLEANCVHAYNLAVTLFELERFPEAETALRRALQFEPDSSELNTRLAWAIAQQGRIGEAIEAASSVAAREHDNPVVLSVMSGVLLLGGRVDAAVEVATDLVRKHPDLASAHETLAYAFFKQGNATASLHHYDRAIALSPETRELHAGRGGALSLAGRHGEAIAEFNIILETIPDYFDRHPEFAHCLAASQKALGRL